MCRHWCRRPTATTSEVVSTELGVAEREGRYGFRRARRGPSVGHGLFGRVNSAECPGAQPTPTRPLPSLLHTAIYPSPCGLPRVQRPFRETASLSLPSCVLRILRSNRSPPSTERFELLRRQQRQQQLAARYLAFLSRPPISLLYSARPPGWAASSRPHSNRTARTTRVWCRAVSDCV
jgi:hypothetical protein